MPENTGTVQQGQGALQQTQSSSTGEIPQGVRTIQQEIAVQMRGATNVRTQTGVAVEPFPDLASFSWGGYWHSLGIMFLLLACLWFLMRFLKRYGKFNFIPRQGTLPRDAFYTESVLPIGQRKCLMVIRFLDKRLVIGVTDQQITLLSEERVRDGVEEPDFEAYLDEHGKVPK